MRWNLGLLVLGLAAGTQPILGPRARNAATLVDRRKLPLHTRGRYIVNTDNERVKWACINWAGAYSLPGVVGGLEVQNLTNLAARISILGFNCVRLCYSTENHLLNPLVKDEDVAANPALKGKRFMEIFDQTVQALTDQGLMVILNNHISRSGWCCNVLQEEGFWYTERFPEEKWMESLLDMTRRFRDNSLVVAFDIRNEPHDIPGRLMTWGDGNPATDWAFAAERAGNAILAVNPDLLIVVSALCFCMDLRPVKSHPIQFNLPNRLVYETHNYIEFQIATLFSNNFFSWRWVANMSTYVLVVLVVLDLVVLYMWLRIGRPWPRKSTLLALISGWAAIFFAVVAGVCAFGYHFYLQYCSYVAQYYFLPNMIICAIASFALLLLGFWAAKFGLRVVATSDDCAILPEVCECAASDDLGSSSEEEAGNVKCRVYQAVQAGGVIKEQEAKLWRVPGFACEPGYHSLWVAQEYCIGTKRKLPRLSQAEAPVWDSGALVRSFGEPMPVGFGIWGLDRRHVCDLDQKEGDFVIDTMLYGLDCFDQLTAQLVKRGGLAEGL
ncbi:4-beta-glucanase E1) (Endocellulase E1) [Durusdinium trenchii]|uniref:4-beta-glucanase E1 (Endocellulase E1 n=1 Tax=Durusdinium trenchii TaxID=1381693 RepID=A0ABP0NND3_9DINO